MRHYGYLDMPDGWSDVDSTPVDVPCVECGQIVSCVAEDTWLVNGNRVVTYCGCDELSDYRAEMMENERRALRDGEDVLPMECIDPIDYEDDYPSVVPDTVIPAGMEDADIYQVW